MDVTLFEENIEILRKSGGKWVDSRLVNDDSSPNFCQREKN